MEALKAEHQSALESEKNSLNKQIDKLTLELKVTQDDFSKTKAALEISYSEADNYKKQLDEARAVPTLSFEHAKEITRLTKELANSKDDFAAVTDELNLTKSSLSEISDKHARELEEGAKSRADEIIKLKSAHVSEVADLAAQKSEAIMKISDLEGELAIVKATSAAQQSVNTVTALGDMEPPKPGKGTVNEGYNPQLDKKRPSTMTDYLQ